MSAGGSSRPRALVTGASAGLGRGYARRLAADSYDLVLVGRDRTRLTGLSHDLESEFGIRAEAVPADLSTDDGIQAVRSVIADSRVDVLINNAGHGLRHGLLDSAPEEVERLDRVLSGAVRVLSLAAAQEMRRRGRGGILTVSSLAALTTMGQYAASKAAALVFTEALADELRDTPVTVTAVLPGFIRTEFHARLGVERPGPDWIWLDVGQVVTTSLADARRGRTVSIPGRQYRVAACLSHVMPRGLVRWGSRRFSFERNPETVRDDFRETS
ncbi:hypothetical protein DFO66_10250 [Brevibacterium sanguinis]|uniref:Short-subunit dehydrogenase n=2 Tax=Brevibacterium TaxID=1696 RepID=A0A366IM07_9MICO|nr:MULTISPECIES: SDR family NAD(P)-dependent oxidoreductase [Brevibacterium]RBP66997.1 hypothetical protein DFO66_10250 [Brevibacterium sanguinis]RBP73522.1 hypothetical protein DFO65_10250 [Brevibacterium celere]